MDTAPITRTVDDLRSNGRDIVIVGWTDDGQRCLIVDRTGGNVTIASRSTVIGIGRWECTPQHYDAYRDVYDPRFPMADDPTTVHADAGHSTIGNALAVLAVSAVALFGPMVQAGAIG